MYNLKQRFMAYRGIVRERDDLLKEYERAWTIATGLKGIRYDQVRMSGGASADQRKIEALERADYLKGQIKRCVQELAYLDLILENMEDDTAEAIRKIYIEGRRYAEVSKEHCISKSGLEKRINKEIEKAEKRMRTPIIQVNM